MAMKRYYWRGSESSGKAVRGSLQAADRNDAVAQLASQGIEPQQLLALPTLLLQRPPSGTEITLLIRQLATLLQSGLTLDRALQGTIAGMTSAPLRILTQQMLDELQQGDPLSTILERRPQQFDRFLCHLIRSGEQSSQLPQLLLQAADHRERQRTMRRQLWKASAYPLGVLTFSLLITLFLLLQVVPQFEVMFRNLGGALPLLTQQLLNTTHWLQQHALQLLTAVALLPLSLYFGYQKIPRFHHLMDRLLLQIPLIGSTLQELTIARTARTLATLQQAATPLHQGLQHTQEMTTLYPLQEVLQQLHQRVLEGTPLSQAAMQSPLFPPIAIQMIHAGEESGELTTMLARLADYYEGEVEHRLQQLTTWLEPLLILLIGGIVATIAIALYQPIFQMGQQL